jgi:TetR/AcrR family acrAB operon transcriptional repressor
MRRTKEESQHTRQKILAAARREFARRGVTRTTLEHIAAAAGVTRGAIYWHFTNKLALFQAMREQVSLPLVDRTDFALLNEADPLVAVEEFLRSLIEGLENDTATRQTFQITVLKCEYVDEFEPELKRQVQRSRELLPKLTKAYARAQHAGTLRAGLTPEVAALETCAFTTGLLRLWLIDSQRTLVRTRVHELISAHVDGRRAHSSPATSVLAAVEASTLH